MQLIQVDDQLADLTAVEQGRAGAFENVSLDMCAIIDRFVPSLLPCSAVKQTLAETVIIGCSRLRQWLYPHWQRLPRGQDLSLSDRAPWS